MSMVEIATISKRYCVHAGVLLTPYAYDKNWATPSRYHT
jgi:hypothetical protein